MKSLPTIFLILVSFSFGLRSYSVNYNAEPDKKTTRKTKKEITKTDITRYKDITAEEILILGIHLNMNINEVKEIISKYPQFYLSVDPFNENRYYLYDTRQINNKNVSLAYFIWDDKSPNSGLKEIIIYFGFSRYLVGNSKNLVTLEVINKNSAIVQDFMGYPSRKEVILDLPALGVKSFSYFYPERKFKVNRYISDDGTSISFSIFRPDF